MHFFQPIEQLRKSPLMTRLSVALVTAMLLLSASTASALTLNFTAAESEAAGARGSLLSLEVNQTGGTVIDPIWTVLMTLDTTSYYGTRAGFNQIGFGAIKDWDSVLLISVTDPFSNDIASDWTTAQAGNITSGFGSPCTDHPDLFKICVDGYSDVKTLMGAYVWEFEIVGGDVQDIDEWHWGGQYSDLGMPGPTEGWIISAVIPEPSAALVFAIGFGVISAAQRKQ